MESNKLTLIESKLPLKAYPEGKIDSVLKTVFKYWLASLLSIKADNENKIDLALAAIKKNFWSLGLDEVKKAFEMYAYGQLKTKPVSNHIDIILVGTIFNEYKEQKVVVKKEIDHNEIMEQTNKIHLLKFFKGYFLTGFINDCYVIFAYDWLEKNGFLNLTKEEKIKLMKDAELLIVIEQKESGNIKDKLKGFKVEDIPNEDKVFNSKKLALKAFLKKMDESQSKEIEKILKT